MNLIASKSPIAKAHFPKAPSSPRGTAPAARPPRRTELLLRNTHQAVAMLQVAEQGLNQASVRLRAMVALAAQAGSDEATAHQRMQFDARFTWLREKLRRIVADTTFNGRSLLAQPCLQFSVDDDPVVLQLPELLQGLDALELVTREGAVRAESDLRTRQSEMSRAAQACRLSLFDLCSAADRALASGLDFAGLDRVAERVG